MQWADRCQIDKQKGKGEDEPVADTGGRLWLSYKKDSIKA